MNLRAVGCAVVGVAVFVGLGVWGLSLAFQDAEGCPPSLQWEDRAYVAEGTPAPSPDLGPGDPVYIGSTFMGPITRRTYGPAGSSPSTDAADRPSLIALDCADGTFQVYRWDDAPTGPDASP
ncbi:MAG TPA: hypothetical protein VH859_02250 [Candidatus Limnocylindria bacterium]